MQAQNNTICIFVHFIVMPSCATLPKGHKAYLYTGVHMPEYYGPLDMSFLHVLSCVRASYFTSMKCLYSTGIYHFGNARTL